MRGRASLTLAATALAAQVAYLLTLLVAGARRAPRAHDGMGPRVRFLVVIPAHNEEAGIGRTLDSIAGLDYPVESWGLVVIADNCTDSTAAIARTSGVRVLVREVPELPGKGHAISWGLERFANESIRFDAIVIVDADCTASANLLQVIDERMQLGADAVQVSYGVSNAFQGNAAALRYAGYALMNTVRPRGKSALGLSAGLSGSGMAFRRELLERIPWSATSLVEDQEQHLRFVAAGVRVDFAPEASVVSAMPTSLRGSEDQQLRWELGRLRLLGVWAPRLIAAGARRRDPGRLHAGLELLVPPQSLLLLSNLVVLGMSTARSSRRARWIATAALGGQLVYVIGGLFSVRAPIAAYRALASAPLLVGQKVLLLVRIARGRGPTRFIRTEREERP